MTAQTLPCKPNISEAGRRMRTRFGYVWLAVTAAGLCGAVALRAPWHWRGLAFFPATLSAIGLLQARRHTCVARAREGTFEHDDLSKTKAPDADVAESRHVSARIQRDSLLIGLAAGALAVATALLR